MLILVVRDSAWLSLLILVVSGLVLVLLVSGLAERGMGSRSIVGRPCCFGLVLLGQTFFFLAPGKHEIHFWDQRLLSAILLGGAILLVPLIRKGFTPLKAEVNKGDGEFLLILAGITNCLVFGLVLIGRWTQLLPRFPIQFELTLVASAVIATTFMWIQYRRIERGGMLAAGCKLRTSVAFFLVAGISLIGWLANPVLFPVTPEKIQRQVESFSPGTADVRDWQRWEIIASWAVDVGLNPDLSRASQMMAEEVSGRQNPFVLGVGFRMGLVDPGQFQPRGAADARRGFLMSESFGSRDPTLITSLNQSEGIIRQMTLDDQLTEAKRDYLEKRLLLTFDALGVHGHGIEDALLVTQLLDVIDRPIDRDKYRRQVQELLQGLHKKRTALFQIAGGFAPFGNMSASLKSTSEAVELMKIYGIPQRLDLNWVRSFLRPLCYRPLNGKWIAAVTLDRLKCLPGVKQVTWAQFIFYEKNLVAAVSLVLLCLYATWTSPVLEATYSKQVKPVDDRYATSLTSEGKC
jgi:hypothetical protein